MPLGATEQQIALLPRIAPADRDAFARRTDVLVTARAVDDLTLPEPPIGIVPHVASDGSDQAFLDATVVNGTLRLTLSDPLERPVRITWLVDTGLGGG
jgi:hypothetical protein